MIMMMTRPCMIFFLAVCALWTLGEAVSCDYCGRECVPTCGTNRFRACCFNNFKKRVPDSGVKLWPYPPRQPEYLQLLYDA